MKVGVITIATGKYIRYVPDLVKSCESFFLPAHDKTYFIFTDGEISMQISQGEKIPNIVRIHQEKLGWPFDSMLRFHMFLDIKNELSKMDYVFFMNANNKIVDFVDDSIFPINSRCGIVAALHPGFFNRNKGNYPYERRPESSFCVKAGEENNYYQGCFNGGRSESFLIMSDVLKQKTDEDLANNIISVWHDESALNWYLIDKDPLVLGPNYTYPEYLSKDDIINNLRENHIYVNSVIADEILSTPESDPHLYIKESGPIKIIQRNKNLDGGKPYLRS
jgi:hypothetical protein